MREFLERKRVYKDSLEGKGGSLEFSAMLHVRLACNRREVNRADCVRVASFQDSGAVPRGAFPAEGVA